VHSKQKKIFKNINILKLRKISLKIIFSEIKKKRIRGVEPLTSSLEGWRSTTELDPHLASMKKIIYFMK
jgi:hypothetical protein